MSVNTYLQLIATMAALLPDGYEFSQDDETIVHLMYDLKSAVDWSDPDEVVRIDQALAHLDSLASDVAALRAALQGYRDSLGA